jgi:hypothetical protein
MVYTQTPISKLSERLLQLGTNVDLVEVEKAIRELKFGEQKILP